MATRTVEVAQGVPALAPERAVTWPKRTKARLSNGLEVILAESHSIPKFHGELFFRSGNAAVADRAPGLAGMTATVVRTGTANELAREAAFPAAEFERERRQKLEEVKLERTQPGFLASERLRKVLFGGHPYGQVSPSEAQVAAYKCEDLQLVYREFYTPENGLLLLVGDFESHEMLRTAEKVFGGWTGKKPESKAAGASIWCIFLARCKRRFSRDAMRSQGSTRIG